MTNKVIILERIYDDNHQSGYRVLVDRIWPRGISKQRAALDDWCKDLAPSTDLRKWFGHKAELWGEFQHRYQAELEHHKNEALRLLEQAGNNDLILVYAAKDKAHTHALVLKDYIQKLADS